MNRFGNSDASRVLELILREPEHCIHSKRVGSIYNDYCIGLKHLSIIKDQVYKERTALLWRNEFFNKVDLGNFPDTVGSHFKNVLSYKYRDIIIRQSPLRKLGFLLRGKHDIRL